MAGGPVPFAAWARPFEGAAWHDVVRRSDVLPRLDRSELLHAGPPFETSREEVRRLLAGTFVLREDFVPSRAYPGREGKEWLAVFERVG